MSISKRAIWIFDKQYASLAYLAVRSFTEHVDMPVTLIYCEAELEEEILGSFRKLAVELEIIRIKELLDEFPDAISKYSGDEAPSGHLLNRLARFLVVRKYSDELIFLLDADMAFSPLAAEIATISPHSIDTPQIWGVVEHQRAGDGYLYFNKKDPKGDAIKVPPRSKMAILQSVFGDEWEKLTGRFQFNNGLLAFWQGKELIEEWEDFYYKGITSPYVNPADDQVPLSAAIQATKIQATKLPSYWNSFGRATGDYIAYHVWAGNWKEDVWRCMEGKKPVTDYGRIIYSFWEGLPPIYLHMLRKQLKAYPFRYRKIPGFFDFGGIYEDVIKTLPSGHLVEVGTYQGASACFMGELIQQSEKPFTFDTIDHFERVDSCIEMVKKTLEEAGVLPYVQVIQAHAITAVQTYEDHSLAFVFLDGDSQLPSFPEELRLWYQKLSPGGILAGYDVSIHDTVRQGYRCVVDTFCKEKKIPLRTYKNRFVIRSREQRKGIR